MRRTIDSFLILDGLSDDTVNNGHMEQNSAPSVESPAAGITPLPFVASGALNWGLLTREYARVESDFVRESVRKNALYLENEPPREDLWKDGSKVDRFGHMLMKKLREHNNGSSCSSSGGYRQMHHTGLPNAATVDPRGEGSILLAEKAATVRIMIFWLSLYVPTSEAPQEYSRIWAKHYGKFHHLVDRLADARVSPLSELCLVPGRFVIVLFRQVVYLAESKFFPQVCCVQALNFLFTVLALYRRGSGKRESVKFIPAIGQASYISVKLYAKFHFQPNHFSDLTCEELCTVTHLHLSPTDVLLSLASYDSQMTRSEITLPLADANSNRPLTLVGVPPDILWLLQSLQAIAAALDGAATEIRKEVKSKKKSKAVIKPAT